MQEWVPPGAGKEAKTARMQEYAEQSEDEQTGREGDSTAAILRIAETEAYFLT